MYQYQLRREDRLAMARRIRAEMEEDEISYARPVYRRQPAFNGYYEGRQPYIGGPIFESRGDDGDYYGDYPADSPRYEANSPRYEPQTRLPAQAARLARRDDHYADRVRALAAQTPREAQSPGVDLHGPTVREAPADRNPEHPKYRETRGSNGKADTYRFLKNIGEGGQGYCDLYQRASDKKLLVCKVMEHSSTSSSKPAEVAILSEILGPHRGIIDLKHWSQSPPTFWYEFCSGGDLQDLIDAYTHRRLRIPEAFIWHSFLHLADAFAYIHTGYDRFAESDRPPRGFRPIVHRDVKPPNIFLRPNRDNGYPDLVLADFGCATTKLRSGENYQIGTPMYQPPELPIHSPQGDVWSLGACIHIMATGSPPIKAIPKGWQSKASGWYDEPSARVVANLEKFGYSPQLDDAMYTVMRSDPGKRLVGKALVKRVLRGYEEWGGKSVALGKWALKG
ncbi:MAG: hypothetical protein Q9216_004327 [Gyalolechia sp. 2 TL-2023]